MFRILEGVLGAVLALSGVSSFAFQLGDHKAIMEQAYTEFVHCFPQFRDLQVDLLVSGDLDEDLNLVQKELFYSHYYNPNKNLNMWRGDSAGRLENLKPDLLLCREDAHNLTGDETSQLGHALHHLQDMAVPPHVVPVSHSFWDGFESYKLTGDISSEWSCEQIAASGADDLATILKETAIDTLNAINGMNVEVVNKVSRAVSHVNGSAFWVEAEGDGFGSYGPFGNNFGEMEIDTDMGALEVSDDAYRAFKRQQMKAAVRASLRGLVEVLQPESATSPSSI